MARPFFTDHMDFQHLTWNRPTWTATCWEFPFLVFLIWLLNLLLNSGRLSDITGWCPKSLATLVQMSLITRDYEIIFIVNQQTQLGGYHPAPADGFSICFPFVFPYNFDGRMCTGGADWCHHHGAYRSVLEHLEAGSNHPISMFSLLVLLYQLPKKMVG